MNFKILVFLCIIIYVHSDDLRCYQCDPRSPGNCESPDKNNITADVCTETDQTATANAMTMTTIILEMGENTTQKPFCYYLYLDAGIPEESGYYRGCSRNSKHVLEFCKSLNERLEQRRPNEAMRDCQLCDVNECNVESFQLIQGKALIDVQQKSNNASVVKDTNSGTLAHYFSLNIVLTLIIGLHFTHF